MRLDFLRVAVLSLLLLAPSAAFCASSQTRLALVVGISKYQRFGELKNTVPDAELIAEKLRAVGFDVDLETDVSKSRFDDALTEFGRKIEAAGRDAVALFYYAGHGVQDDRRFNYLIPADADVRSQVDLPRKAIKLEDVLDTLEQAGPRAAFAIVDACRDNPLPLSEQRGARRGLATESARRGQLIVFSTEPGKTALDGDGDHSPFAQALADKIGAEGVEATVLFREVSMRVLDVTKQEQFPWVTQRLLDAFYFRGGPGAAPAPLEAARAPDAGAVTTADAGEVDYGRAVIANSKSAYESWLARYSASPKRQNVIMLLQRLNEEELWRSAERAASPAEAGSALDRLLIAFPDGAYAEKARQRQTALRAPPVEVTPQTPPQAAPPAPRPAQLAYPSSPPSVSRYAGMDAPGNDRGGWIFEVRSVEDCETICLADSGCAGYTYNGAKATCIPKSQIAMLAPHPDRPVTGVVATPTRRRLEPAAAPAPASLSGAEILVAGRLFRNFQQRYLENGAGGLEESVRLCYRNAGKVNPQSSPDLYCSGLDLLAARTLMRTQRMTPRDFNELQNAYRRARSFLGAVAGPNAQATLERADLIATQIAADMAAGKPPPPAPR